MLRLFFLFSIAALPLPAMANDFFALPKSLEQGNGKAIPYKNMNACQKELLSQWLRTVIVYEDAKKQRTKTTSIDQKTINQMMLNQQLYNHQLNMLMMKYLQ